MKIRSEAELLEYLDTNLKIRKRELTTYKFIVSETNREHEKAVLMRAAIPLIYAHWEGFIKEASTAYLELVSNRKPLLKDLTTNFIAASIRDMLRSTAKTKRIKSYDELVRFVFENYNKHVSFDPGSLVEVENSNINSDVLQNIMNTVGLEFSGYWETKIQVIDQKLLKHRNEIAHGELVKVNEGLYNDLHTFVVDSLNMYKTLILNAATVSGYKKSS
jgi:hypothetical protein